MARGLLTGALFFLCITLVMIIMILWPDSPWSTWLMEKTELGDDFCWFGEGIWRTNIVWGQSSRELRCGRHGMRESDAIDLYCSDRTLKSGNMFDDPSLMCSIAKWGRFCMSLGAVLSFIGAFLVVAVHFTTSLETRKLRLNRATVVLSLSFVSHTILFLLMTTSPLFDSFHFQYLGKENRVNYKGLGCVFQSPFVGGIVSLLTSSPLKCLYPGPALPLTIGIVVFQFMACLMLILLLIDTNRRIRLARAHSVRDQRVRSLEDPLLGGETQSVDENGDRPRRRSCCEYLFGTGAKDYQYSLHGAFLRRLSRFHRLEQNLAIIVIPMVVVGNGMLLVSWFYHGMQFLVHVRVHNQQIFKDTSFDGELNGNMTFPVPNIKEITIVELREQVFTFDPVTSLITFWESRGYLLTLITAFWLDFFPFLKVFIWLFYWFVPQSEVIRGRVLTWIDYLGKWTLANLFTLCIISVAFLFKSSLHLPIPLPFNQGIMLELECIVESGAGVTWFIFSLLWTIAMGDVFLQFHTLAREWEVQRRRNKVVETHHGGREDEQSQHPHTHLALEGGFGELSRLRPLESTPALGFEHGHLSSYLRTVGAFEDDSPVPSSQQGPILPASNLSTISIGTAPPVMGRIDEQNPVMNRSPYSPSQQPNQPHQVSRSLFREIVRRTSAQFIVSPHLKQKKETLEEFYFTPMRSQRHRFSSKGRFVVWVALTISLCIVIMALTLPVIHFNKTGAVPDVLLEAKEAEYSLLQFVPAITKNGATVRPAYELAFGFAVFGVVFPVVHGISLFFLWGYPMTVSHQLQVFRFIEFCDAWNALDVFFVGCFVVWVGLETISRKVVEIVVPGLTAAGRTFFGESDIMVIIPELQYGFWWIGVAMLGQKMVSHVLMELTASTIAQRQFALQKSEQTSSPGGFQSSRVGGSTGSGSQQPSGLSHDELLLFSPAARYVGVSGVDSTMFYAGLPLWVWRLGVTLGLMDVFEE